MKPKRLVLFQTCAANPFDANSDDDSLCRSDRMQYGYGNIGQMDLYTAECIGHIGQAFQILFVICRTDFQHLPH